MKKSALIIFLIIIIFVLNSINSNSSKIEKVDSKLLKSENTDVDVIVKLKNNANIPGEEREFSSFNGFHKEVTKKELEKLIKDNRVERIEENSVNRLFLQQSAPLINATPSWAAKINNTNITGIGESVCVIDTGINSSHADFQNKIAAEYCFCSDNTDRAGNCCPSGAAEEANALDINGHGTHVAGIIAASGTIKGIANGAKIVAIRVFDADNAAYDNDIINAIDWCVNNASLYNISVISMSLGSTSLYSRYCDSEKASYASSINNAIGKNISVVVATGNDGNYTAIASPACIENSTAVGAVYDANVGSKSWSSGCTDSTTLADKITCFTDRNNLTDLLAPGALINSTYLTGYSNIGGTSMATPMVSASFALLNQYYKLQGRQATPSQIQFSLNKTGKIIYDSSTGLNFSRVDIYSAMLDLDISTPNVTLILQNSATTNQNVTFNCNATDLQLRNITLNVWNSTGIYYSNITNASGVYAQANWTKETGFNNYSWNCYSCDTKNNCGFAARNNSITVSSFIIILNSSANSNSNLNNFSCNLTSQQALVNVTFMIWNSSLVYNETRNISGLSNYSLFSINFSQYNEGNYLWNCLASNNQSYSYSDYNSSFSYDLTSPNITLISPADAYSTTATAISFSYNVTDISSTNCSLILDSNTINFNSSVNITGGTTIFANTSTVASHTWSVNCTDAAGNTGNSSVRSLVITASSPAVTTGNNGGGGGGSYISVINSTTKKAEQTTENSALKNITNVTSDNNNNTNLTKITGEIDKKSNRYITYIIIALSVIFIIYLAFELGVNYAKKKRKKS